MVDDYPYEGMSFRDDFYLPFPKEEEWSNSVMNETMNVFGFLYFVIFFIF